MADQVLNRLQQYKEFSAETILTGSSGDSAPISPKIDQKYPITTLISLYDPDCIGNRTLATFVKSKIGHSVNQIYFKDLFPERYPYVEGELDLLIDLLRQTKTDLIGISLRSSSYTTAVGVVIIILPTTSTSSSPTSSSTLVASSWVVSLFLVILPVPPGCSYELLVVKEVGWGRHFPLAVCF